MLLKSFALVCILLAGGIFYWFAQQEEATREVSSLSVDLREARRSLAKHCREMTEQLAEQGITNSFNTVVYNLHEPRLEREPILKDLPKCFTIDESSSRVAEVAIFTSDAFDGSKADKVGDMQFQVSVIDRKTRNKLAEAAFYIGGVQ